MDLLQYRQREIVFRNVEAALGNALRGQGAQAATADVLSFSRSKGAFVGVSLEGTIVKPAEDLNKAFYAKSLSPVDILVRGEGGGEAAAPLKTDLEAASGKK